MCQHFSGCCTDKALKQRRTTKFLHWGAAEEPAGSCGVPEDRAGLWTEAVGPHSTHSPGLVFVPMCMCCAKSLQSCLTLCSPLDSGPPGYMGFSGQEYWSGLPCHPSGDLPDPGIEPTSLKSPDLAAGSLPLTPPEKPNVYLTYGVRERSILFFPFICMDSLDSYF